MRQRREQNLIEDPTAHPDIETARNMPDAANAQQSIQGYAALTAWMRMTRSLASLSALSERGEEQGDADGDWFRAEEEVQDGGRSNVGQQRA